MSIDGPARLHDVARGLKGTFERTCAGLRRLQEAARRKGAPLRVSINTTVAHESLDTLDQMVDVAEELGVDAIGLNHLMFSTPEEVAETVRSDRRRRRLGDRDVRHADPGLDVARVREQVAALERRSAASANVLFDFRPKVLPQLMDNYYTPGTKLEGRCLYPFLHARVSFSGKVYFCPFIRVEVGDLDESTLEEVWNGERYVDMRKRLLDNGMFPVCRRCCKVELSPEPLADRRRRRPARAPRDSADGGPLTMTSSSDRRRCSSIRRSSTASRSRGRAAARNAKRCSARPSRRTRSRSSPSLLREPAATYGSST